MPDVYALAGKAECCSIGGGQHWTVAATGGELDAANSGDLVILADVVGVALTDYDTDADSIVVDLYGCHEIEVTAVAQGGGGLAIAVGDIVMWDNSAGFCKGWDAAVCAASDVLFGLAMEAIGSGDTDTICVKLQPMPTERA